MADIRSLERTPAENVTWNKARRNFLAKFTVALIQVKTVSLVQIASVMSGRAKQDSHYKRCQRFLRFFDLPSTEIARLVIKLLGILSLFVVFIERTDWYLGETPLHIFMLSVVYQGVAFPLRWTVLEKRGCSDTRERVELLEAYLKLFGKDSGLVCDHRPRIYWPGLISISAAREDHLSHSHHRESESDECPWQQNGLREEPLSHTPGRRRPLALWSETSLGEEVSLMGMRTRAGECVIVASSTETEQILSDDAQRGKSETLFGGLKSRGFCLEETHGTRRGRLEKLLALMTVAFWW